ncbi:MAG: TIGR03564 family F420-dependent LLM class oxidoreductase, partial [Candidatus Binatia bacterium]
SGSARSTSRIEVGTAVVPTYPRHPVVMAQQALTVQSALGGRFTLGIPFERPVRHMREYLEVVLPLVRGEAAALDGELYKVRARVGVRTDPVPVVIAALGPRMLEVAGELVDGTILSWVGHKTIETHIAPRIGKAAANAGRQAPRIIAGLPISVTDDRDAAREAFAPSVTGYGALPSYRAMFDIEGAERPADVALFGDEAALDAELRRLEDAGATDFQAQVVNSGPGSSTRTLEFLASRIT